MSNNPSNELHDVNAIIANRQQKLAKWREQTQAFPNDFRRDALAASLHAAYDDKSADFFDQQSIVVSIAGRIMLRRMMGKASFVTLQDMSDQLQVYVRSNDIAEALYDEFKHWDLGDIIGVTGRLFKTKTGELSVHASQLRLLTKSLRPLPEKFHGLHDQETRYRQRYLDLIVNPEVRKTFLMRNRVIHAIRDFLNTRDFLEVETPMLHTMPGGAAARPFATHHHALNIPMFLRIAPELYLKRLVVGGFEKVYEINRNFRNEGISPRHNPEFTMLEFYWAYADYHDLMTLTEVLFRELAQKIGGALQISYRDHLIDFAKPFQRISVQQAVLAHNADLNPAILQDRNLAAAYAVSRSLAINPSDSLGKIHLALFENTVEPQLIQPTFITEYPVDVSPLSRRNDNNPFVTDRFELFIAAKEIANGFSELNDPEDQAARFRQQVAEREAGDSEAMLYDEDYITALEYGLPPTAGEGIGIDRLVMLLTNAASIRDVILFPHMKPLSSS